MRSLPVVRWERRGRSRWLDDRRGRRGGVSGFGLPIGFLAKLGLPGVLIAVVAMVFLGPDIVLGGGGPSPGIDVGFPPVAEQSEGARFAPEDDTAAFVNFLVEDIQGMWDEQFEAAELTYKPARLVLFTRSTPTGCGSGSAATGPFYCPADQQVYIDLGFFGALRERFGAPGDFAQAYVVAHEFGHHVQNILGISDEVRRAQREDPEQANELSVLLELQADCLAGVWGHTAKQRGILEPGDLEEGLAAAAAIGDDRIQREATGRVDPESWTHGSSQQRVAWFRVGFDEGDVNACDTFRD